MVVADVQQCRKQANKEVSNHLVYGPPEPSTCLFADAELLFWFQNKFVRNPTFIMDLQQKNASIN